MLGAQKPTKKAWNHRLQRDCNIAPLFPFHGATHRASWRGFHPSTFILQVICPKQVSNVGESGAGPVSFLISMWCVPTVVVLQYPVNLCLFCFGCVGGCDDGAARLGC